MKQLFDAKPTMYLWSRNSGAVERSSYLSSTRKIQLNLRWFTNVYGLISGRSLERGSTLPDSTYRSNNDSRDYEDDPDQHKETIACRA